MFRHFPKRITRNIGNDDRRSAICRCPARAGTRSNRQLFHLLPPSLGKTRARHGIQMKTIGTKQQNRSKRAAAVLFDNHAEAIQDFLERNSGGNHLEKALFTAEQRLPSLVLGNVYRGTGIIMDFAGLLQDGSAHAMDMLNRSVRKRDSKFNVKAGASTNCFIETSLDK